MKSRTPHTHRLWIKIRALPCAPNSKSTSQCLSHQGHCTQSCYRWLSAADGTNALPDRSWLRFTTGNVMEERCSFAIHISNITRNTNSFIHDSFGLHSSKEQEIRILSYGVHFIEYRKFQTIEMHSQHMLLNMFRSGIKFREAHCSFSVNLDIETFRLSKCTVNIYCWICLTQALQYVWLRHKGFAKHIDHFQYILIL